MVEALSNRIFRLFTLAFRMNFGAFFPLSQFLAQLLTRDVFLALQPECQRRALTLVGHADLESDDSLFVVLAQFLSSDFHRSHDILWETILYRWSTMRQIKRDDARLVALAVAAERPEKRSYGDALTLIEKRFGVYFLRVGENNSWMELRHYVAELRNCGDENLSRSVLAYLESL